MAEKKTYRSGLPLNFFLKVNGRIRLFEFQSLSSKSHFDYSTSNEAEQKALESSKQFGKSYELLQPSTETANVAPKKEKKEFAAVYPKAKKIQDAIRVLVEKHEVDEASLQSKTDVLRKASELNISFPNLA